MKQEDLKLAVIGLGYVGLPLAAEFAKYRPVIGFDIDLFLVGASLPWLQWVMWYEIMADPIFIKHRSIP